VIKRFEQQLAEPANAG